MSIIPIEYKDEYKKYLIDNNIPVPKEKESLSFNYDIGEFDNKKIEIEERRYSYGTLSGEVPQRIITLPLDAEGSTVFTTVDNKKYYFTVVEKQNIYYPLILIIDTSDEFIKFWRQHDKIANIVLPAKEEGQMGQAVAKPHPSSALMATDAWKPAVFQSKDFNPVFYTGERGGYTLMCDSRPGKNAYLRSAYGYPFYTYKNDEPGVSRCTGDCLGIFRPFLLEVRPTIDPNIVGEAGVIERKQDLDPFAAQRNLQITFNNQPLYYCEEESIKEKDSYDKEPQCDGVDGLWSIVPVESDFKKK